VRVYTGEKSRGNSSQIGAWPVDCELGATVADMLVIFLVIFGTMI
jgi:hypothetical protein